MLRHGIAGVLTDGDVRLLMVPGIPAPAGSKTGFPFKRHNGSIGVAITDASKRSKPWKAQVAAMAADAWKALGAPLAGPVSIEMDFVMPRPKSHYGHNRELGRYLKPGSPLAHTSKPDVLKLARAVEDALIGLAYLGDEQIAEERLSKRYGESPGVTIRLVEIR